MKKIILSLIIVGVVSIANAQSRTSNALERLKSELFSQTKGENYNPYRYSSENFIISCLALRIEWESSDCNRVNEVIGKFYEADSMRRDNEISDIINNISLFQCEEAYNFLETLIKSNPSETVRCNAIEFLAWSLNPNYLPCILEYAKKDSLSTREKLAIATAFQIFGIYTSHTDLKEEAIKFLDEICYDSSSDTIQGFDPSIDIIKSGCFWNYYKLRGKAAITFFYFLFLKLEVFRIVVLAVHCLAPFGEYKTTFPIFMEAIHSEITNNVLEAIDGLKVIGTEEALRLIEEQTHNKNEKIAKKAQETLLIFDIERRKK
jgi:HEAT repeat protein